MGINASLHFAVEAIMQKKTNEFTGLDSIIELSNPVYTFSAAVIACCFITGFVICALGALSGNTLLTIFGVAMFACSFKIATYSEVRARRVLDAHLTYMRIMDDFKSEANKEAEPKQETPKRTQRANTDVAIPLLKDVVFIDEEPLVTEVATLQPIVPNVSDRVSNMNSNVFSINAPVIRKEYSGKPMATPTKTTKKLKTVRIEPVFKSHSL